MSDTSIPVLVSRDGRGDATLHAPKVGVWSDPPRNGARIEPGSSVGRLTQLRRRFILLVPDGVSGRVAIESAPVGAVPVGYGETLFRVAPFESRAAAALGSDAGTPPAVKDALRVSAPTDGVFYRSPARDARPYVVVGDRVTAGQPVGLIEVMKTFNPIAYAGAGLPDEAEIVEVLVADGAEVRAGQPLVVVKPL